MDLPHLLESPSIISGWASDNAAFEVLMIHNPLQPLLLPWATLVPHSLSPFFLSSGLTTARDSHTCSCD